MSRAIIVRSLVLTVLIEGITVFFRFGLGMESTRDTASVVSPLTFGLRIHHGYLGIILLALTCILLKAQTSKAWLIPVSISLILSDLIHHFLVLWPIVGSPQFDLTY